MSLVEPPSLCARSLANKAALAILGSYRRSDVDDPEIFVATVVRILMAFPPDVVMAVADPVNGIASRQTFLPSPAELRAELDRRMEPRRRDAEREQRYAETRALAAPPPDRATPEERERAVKHWEAEKARIAGKVAMASVEQQRAAEKRLTEFYHDYQRPWPLPIGGELCKKIDALAVELANEKRKAMAEEERG